MSDRCYQYGTCTTLHVLAVKRGTEELGIIRIIIVMILFLERLSM